MKYLIHNHLYKLIYFAICLLAIIVVIGFEGRVNKDRQLPLETISSMTVRIKSVPKYKDDSVSFIAVPGKESNIKCAVSVRIEYAENLELYIGDTLKLGGVLEIPSGALNPGGFDYGDYLKSQGASLIFNSNIYEVYLLKEGKLRPLYILRNNISDKILKYISPEEAGLIKALVTGDKDSMSDNLKEAFRRAGVYHVVAVSGLHLNLIVIFLSTIYLSINLKRRQKSLLSFVITSLVCSFMFIFTGFGVSVERAAFMAASVCLAGLFMREYSPFASLFAIMIIVLFTEPWSYRDISFCLSFSATAGVLAGLNFAKRLPKIPGRLAPITESFIITQCASIATMPFLVYEFSSVSVIGIVSNIVIVGIVPLLLGLSYMFAVIICVPLPEALSGFFANAVSAPAYTVNLLTKLFAKIPFGYLTVSSQLMVLIISGITAAVSALKTRKKSLRAGILIIIAVANISFLSYNSFMDKSVVRFLNVGQGDSSVIQGSDGSIIMIDCGSESYGSIAENELLPHLKRSGIFKIDALFITHYHADHAGGAAALIDTGYVKNIILPDRVLCEDEKTLAEEIHSACVKNNIPMKFVSVGDVVSCGDSHVFEILNPLPYGNENPNDSSMVINYKYKDLSVLYMGDTEEKSQYRMRTRLPDCDIIKVSHHGARCTMSDETSEKVKAEYAVISCGENNKYNHPDDDTLKAYKNSKILRTDTDGMISFTLKGDKITLER